VVLKVTSTRRLLARTITCRLFSICFRSWRQVGILPNLFLYLFGIQLVFFAKGTRLYATRGVHLLRELWAKLFLVLLASYLEVLCYFLQALGFLFWAIFFV